MYPSINYKLYFHSLFFLFFNKRFLFTTVLWFGGVLLVYSINMSKYSAQSRWTDFVPSCVCFACGLGYYGRYFDGLTKVIVKKIIITDHG